MSPSTRYSQHFFLFECGRSILLRYPNSHSPKMLAGLSRATIPWQPSKKILFVHSWWRGQVTLERENYATPNRCSVVKDTLAPRSWAHFRYACREATHSPPPTYARYPMRPENCGCIPQPCNQTMLSIADFLYYLIYWPLHPPCKCSRTSMSSPITPTGLHRAILSCIKRFSLANGPLLYHGVPFLDLGHIFDLPVEKQHIRHPYPCSISYASWKLRLYPATMAIKRRLSIPDILHYFNIFAIIPAL